MRPARRQDLAALLVYALLAVVATYPLVGNLSTHLPTIPGEMGQDVWQNSWNVWWVSRALLVEHTNPYHTTMLFYPEGASLYLHSLILPLGIIGLPLTPLLGIVTTYNLLTLLVVVLTGYSSFLLARHLVGNGAAALVTGAIAICSPQRLFELRGAQMATLNDYAVPLALLCLLIALERRTWSMATLTGAALLLAGLNKWYHLFHALLAMGVIFCWRMGGAWRASRRAALRHEWRPWGRVALVSTLLLLPFLLPAMAEALATTYAWRSDELVISADLAHLLPSSFGGVWERVPPNWWYTHLFAWVPLLLGGIGLVLEPRKGGMWAVAALVFFVLSLGPHLRIANNDTGIPLPYAIFRALPVFEIFRAPVRMNLITTLMIGILAAFGVARVSCWLSWSHRRSTLVSLALVVLIAAESLRLPFPLVEARVSPFYHQVAAEGGEWSLLELPFDRADREVLEMYQQTHHGHAILTGRPARTEPKLPYRAAPPIAMADAGDTRPDIVTMGQAERDQLLRGLRVRYLVVRDHPSEPMRAQQQVATARETLGPLTAVYSDTELRAYQLDEIAAWLDGAGADGREDVPLFVGLDRQWPPREESGYGWMRWLPPEGAGLWVYTPRPRRVVLALSLYSVAGAVPLELWQQGRHIQTVPVAEGLLLRDYVSGPLDLPAGATLLELRVPAAQSGPVSPTMSDDERRLTVSIHGAQLHEVRP